MASGATAAKARIANPGPNPARGGLMGGGCQGNGAAPLYAHAVPPSWNCGAMVVLEQRAYFSAWRMVFDVPSVSSSRRVVPCGPITDLCETTMALGAWQDAPNEKPLIV